MFFTCKLCELTDDISVSILLIFVKLSFQYFLTHHTFISLKSSGKYHKNISLYIELVTYLPCHNSVMNPLNLANGQLLQSIVMEIK